MPPIVLLVLKRVIIWSIGVGIAALVIIELISRDKVIFVAIVRVTIVVLVRPAVSLSWVVRAILLYIPLSAVIVVMSSAITLVVLSILIILVILIIGVILVLKIIAVVIAWPSILSSVVVGVVSLVVALVTTLAVIGLSPRSLIGVAYLLNTVVHLYYEAS